MLTTLALTAGAAETPVETPALEGVGFWRRALARMLDQVVHFMVGYGVGLLVGALVMIGNAARGGDPAAMIQRLSATSGLDFLAGLLGSLAMHTVAEGLHGSTIGKRLCGLTVVTVGGAPPTLGGALKRNIAFLWDALFFGMIAAQRMSQSPLNQRYGDAWANTQVVRLSVLTPDPGRSWLGFGLAVSYGLAANVVILLLAFMAKLA